MDSDSPRLLHRCLQIHAGKHLFELNQNPLRHSSNPRVKTIFVISREEVEAGNISRFLSTFGLHSPVEQLRSLQGNTLILVGGYDDHPDPLFTIQEVRTFFAKCHSYWPCWNFFAELDTESLAMIVSCLIRNLTSVRRDRDVTIALHEEEATSLFVEGLATTAYLHHKVGTDREAGAKLLQQVADYLQIPES